MNKNSLSLLLLLAIGHTAHAGFGDFVKTYICCCCCPQTDDSDVELQKLIPFEENAQRRQGPQTKPKPKRTRVKTTVASEEEQPDTFAKKCATLEAVFVGTQKSLLANKKATGGTQR